MVIVILDDAYKSGQFTTMAAKYPGCVVSTLASHQKEQ
jgi:hypothetical protein